jgi:hypothetical protein
MERLCHTNWCETEFHFAFDDTRMVSPRSGRTRGGLARRQQMIATRLVSRNCLLKTGQGSRPQFDALEIGMDPTERFDQIADDEIFCRLGCRYGGLLVMCCRS